MVADGMGGHAGGEYASAIAVNTVEEIVTSIELNGVAGDDSGDPAASAMEKLSHSIRLAGRRIFEKAEEKSGIPRHGDDRGRVYGSGFTWVCRACRG